MNAKEARALAEQAQSNKEERVFSNILLAIEEQSIAGMFEIYNIKQLSYSYVERLEDLGYKVDRGINGTNISW